MSDWYADAIEGRMELDMEGITMNEPRCQYPGCEKPETANIHRLGHHEFVSPSEPEVGPTKPAECPLCHAESEDEAGDCCSPVEDSCPMMQPQFLNRWPSQAEFDAHEKLQAQIADLQVAEAVAPEPKPEHSDELRLAMQTVRANHTQSLSSGTGKITVCNCKICGIFLTELQAEPSQSGERAIAPHLSQTYTDLTVRCHGCGSALIWRYLEEKNEIEVFHDCLQAAKDHAKR